jgi:hypothetical protein
LRAFFAVDALGLGICAPLVSAPPAPWSLTLGAGLPVPLTFALQGAILDPSNPLVYSITNAVLCVID